MAQNPIPELSEHQRNRYGLVLALHIILYIAFFFYAAFPSTEGLLLLGSIMVTGFYLFMTC